MNIFQGDNANSIWESAAKELINNSNLDFIDSRQGKIRELLHSVLTLHNPRQRWITSRHPIINPAFALAEIVWIINGSNDANLINFWNPTLPKYAGNGSQYHGAYGYRLRKHLEFDQLNKAYNALLNNPNSRQVVLQIWDSRIDFPDENGIPASDDIPCNICSLLKVRNNKLEWTQILRSNDVYRGLPYNFIQFTTLQEIMAGWLNLELGDYVHISDSLHVYEKDLKDLIINSNLIIENSDTISIPYSISMKQFEIIMDSMQKIAFDGIGKREFQMLVEKTDLLLPYRNIYLVIMADAARRMEWYDLSDYFINNCENKLFILIYKSWYNRMQKIS